MNALDITGQKFNMLTAIEFSHANHGKSFWKFACDCGRTKIMTATVVKNGYSKSCGCTMGKGQLTHGMTDSPEYNSWCAMRKRVNNVNHVAYHRYGGRGITVCSEWEDSFENFYADMGERPKETSLDRIDNTKGYFKENCRWADRHTQASNTRGNIIVHFNGEDITVAEFARRNNIKESTLNERRRRLNISPEEAAALGVPKRNK